jgi:hypothetical protein
VLFLVAIANLFTKKVATIYGVTFTILLYGLFLISERINARKKLEHRTDLEKFTLEESASVDGETLRARPGCVVVAVRDHRRLTHLQSILKKTNLRKHDIVALTVRQVSAAAAEFELQENQVFAVPEQELFSHVVSLAEKQGKTVELVAVPAVDPFEAMVRTATNLRASKLVVGVSARMASEELARRIGLAWEKLPEPRHPFSLEISSPEREPVFVNLGPHPPRLWPEDVERVHQLWLRLAEETSLGSKLHHRDVVGVALRALEERLDSRDRQEVLQLVEKESRTPHPEV